MDGAFLSEKLGKFDISKRGDIFRPIPLSFLSRTELTFICSAEEAEHGGEYKAEILQQQQKITVMVRNLLQANETPDRDATRILIAFEEALVNACLHGNLGVASEDKEDSEVFKAITSREILERTVAVRIELKSMLSEFTATITIIDEGDGFNPNDLPDPTDPENLEKPSGRGVHLMKSFMDEVTFNPQGNQVTMKKSWTPENVEDKVTVAS